MRLDIQGMWLAKTSHVTTESQTSRPLEQCDWGGTSKARLQHLWILHSVNVIQLQIPTSGNKRKNPMPSSSAFRELTLASQNTVLDCLSLDFRGSLWTIFWSIAHSVAALEPVWLNNCIFFCCCSSFHTRFRDWKFLAKLRKEPKDFVFSKCWVTRCDSITCQRTSIVVVVVIVFQEQLDRFAHWNTSLIQPFILHPAWWLARIAIVFRGTVIWLLNLIFTFNFFYMVCWILQIATSCNIGHIHTFQAHKFFNSCHDPSLRDGRDVSQPFHEGQQNVCHVFGRVKPGRPHHWQHDEQSGKNQIAAKCCKPCPQESFGFKGRKPVLILTFITFISFSFIRIVSQSATP